MKKILGVIFLSLVLSGAAYAESAIDYIQTKKGSLDNHFICVEQDSKDKYEFGFKKIDDDLIAFGYDPKEKVYDGVESIVKIYKSKLQGADLDVFIFYRPMDPTYPTGSGINFKILAISKKLKHHIYQDYWIDNRSNDKNGKNYINTEWERIMFEETEESFNKKLSEWTDNVHELVSKKLDFGDPFEMVDLEVAPWEKALLKHPTKGFMIFFNYQCKK